MGRDALAEGGDLGRGQVGAVGLLGLQTISELGGVGDLGRHRVEVVHVALGERHADLPAPVSAAR